LSFGARDSFSRTQLLISLDILSSTFFLLFSLLTEHYLREEV
jgi:hypothetical protein